MVGIRLATHADLEPALRMRAAAWRESYAGLVPTAAIDAHTAALPASLAHWTRRLDEGASLWLAVEQGQVVGLAAAGVTGEPDAPTPLELEMLYLLERVKGRGVGRRLLWTTVGDAPCYLWVLAGNTPAITFYERHGFVLDGATQESAAVFEGVKQRRMTRAGQP